MKKRWILMMIISLMMLAGCGNGEEKVPVQESEDLYPLTVTDQLGRSVTVEAEPETVVSGYYISTGIMIALGEEDTLVGIENKGETRPIYQLAAPELLALPAMGTMKTFDLETCAALDPDLVILPYKLKDMEEALNQLEIPVIFVKPETKEQLEEAIQLISSVTNSKERADQLKQFTDRVSEEALEAVSGAEQPSVYLSGNSSFLFTAGVEMYQHGLIEGAGGKNVAEELTDTYWAEISYEQLLAWDPEYIIMAADADYTVEDVLKDPVLAECTAVKEGKVYQVPNEIESWDSPVPGSVLGNLWLTSVLHPQEYPAERYEEAVMEYYETFYGFTPEL